MEEKVYRSLIAQAFDRLEKAFEKVDPDVAECERGDGTLTITLQGRSKIVASPQPYARQIWLAVASQGKAFRFAFEPTSQKWIDDRGEGLELFGQISKAVAQVTGVEVSI